MEKQLMISFEPEPQEEMPIFVQVDFAEYQAASDRLSKVPQARAVEEFNAEQG